jgi:hypothetical protein
MAKEATLFQVRKALWYVQRRTLGGRGQASQGNAYYVAENPPFGAVFTYYLADALKSLEDQRREGEKKLEKEWKDTPYVGWDALERERRQPKAAMLLTVRDADGNVVRTVTGPTTAGFHRVAWDLTYPTTSAVRPTSGQEWRRWGGDPNSGAMAPPGTYSVTLSKRVDGQVTDLAGPIEFEVVRVFEGALDGTPPAETAAYMQQVASLQRAVSAASQVVDHGFDRIEYLEKALARSKTAPGDLDTELEALKQRLYEVDHALSGNRSIQNMGEASSPTISRRLRTASSSDGRSDYGPTAMHRRNFEIASQEFSALEPKLRQLLEVDLPALEAKMEEAGVPWSPGRPLPEVRHN